jgi:murein DD-endopeptidase MepM/ murein hydrolase activator NlpD
VKRLAAAIAAASAVIAPGFSAAQGPTPGVVVAGDAVTLEGDFRQGGLVRGRAPGATAVSLDGRSLPLASNGAFILGFGRDAAPVARLSAAFPDGRTAERQIAVAGRAWPLRNLRTLPKGTPRTPAEIVRRADEVARVAAARARLQPSEGWRQTFRWPVTGRVSGVFGAQTIYAGEPGSYHSGVDVARPTGTAVTSPADGIVVLASPPQFSVEGNLLIVDHGMGLSSAFLHLSRIDVPVGARLRQGQVVGAIGTTGRSTGPHLHWGVVWQGVRVDPRALVGAMP